MTNYMKTQIRIHSPVISRSNWYDRQLIIFNHLDSSISLCLLSLIIFSREGTEELEHREKDDNFYTKTCGISISSLLEEEKLSYIIFLLLCNSNFTDNVLLSYFCVAVPTHMNTEWKSKQNKYTICVNV